MTGSHKAARRQQILRPHREPHEERWTFECHHDRLIDMDDDMCATTDLDRPPIRREHATIERVVERHAIGECIALARSIDHTGHRRRRARPITG